MFDKAKHIASAADALDVFQHRRRVCARKIAMTAPVSQQTAGGAWKVRFVMPSSYTLETLPTPNNAAVKLIAVPAERFAAIRFSGLAGDEAIAHGLGARTSRQHCIGRAPRFLVGFLRSAIGEEFWRYESL